MSDTLKTAIAVDNYKLHHFKVQLTKNEYEFTCKPFTPNITSIFVEVSENEMGKFTRLVKQMNLDATVGNN